MCIIRFLKRLFARTNAGRVAPASADKAVREIQRSLMKSARENGLPRTGA